MIKPESVLSLSPTVSVLPLGEELTVFDAATGQTLALNRTAADVLALVDGSTPIEDLGVELARWYGLPSSVALAAVIEVAQALLDTRTVRISDGRALEWCAPS